MFLIEEILNEQSTLDSVDVSKSALEGKNYYSSQAFEKLSRLLNSSVGTTHRTPSVSGGRCCLYRGIQGKQYY